MAHTLWHYSLCAHTISRLYRSYIKSNNLRLFMNLCILGKRMGLTILSYRLRSFKFIPGRGTLGEFRLIKFDAFIQKIPQNTIILNI